MSARVHHSAICTRDVEASLRFWRDGIGLDVIMDEHFGGPWRELFGARADGLRSIFLGDPQQPDAGVVELVVFDGHTDEALPASDPRYGFFLLSLDVDVDAALARLAQLELGGEPRRVEIDAPGGTVQMATVRDPDGVLVELIGRPGAAS